MRILTFGGFAVFETEAQPAYVPPVVGIAGAEGSRSSIAVPRVNGLAQYATTPVIGARRALQRRCQALLAILAAAGPKGVSRDVVTALLWPESNAEHARNALRQTIFRAKRDLGLDQLVVGSADLTLSPENVQTDVGEFTIALSRGERERAAVLYQGPFLEGFHLDQAPHFESWLDGERARLARVARELLQALAQGASSRGDHESAVNWWGRCAALDPLDERVAKFYMEALAACGDTAGALRHARVHESLLRSELDVTPSAETQALVERLRTPIAPSPIIRWPSPAARLMRAAAEIGADQGATAPPIADPAASLREEVAPRWRRHLLPASARVRAITLAAVMLGVGGIVSALLHDPTATGYVPRHDVVVFPFRVDAADSSLAFLAEGIADLLSAVLVQQGNVVPNGGKVLADAWRAANEESGDVISIAARATQRVGAKRAVIGAVVGNSKRIIVSASVMSVDGRLLHVPVQVAGVPDSLLTLIDRLASALLAGEATNDPRRLADLTTRSPVALRAYLRGLSAVRVGNRELAVASFRSALEADTTFALAALGLATSGAWASHTLAERLQNNFASGWALRGMLAPRERALFDAAVGPYDPADDSDQDNLTRWAEAARNLPDRADVAYEYGDRLFHTGNYLQLPNADTEAARLFAFAVKADSSQRVALAHLVELAITRGDLVTASRLHRIYASSDSTRDVGPYLTWRLAIATDDAATLRRMRGQFPQLSSASLLRIQGFSQLDGIPLPDAARALAVLSAREQNTRDHALTLHRVHAFALNAGNLVASGRALDAMTAASAQHTDDASVLGDAFDLAVSDALFSRGDTTRAARAVATLAAREQRLPLATRLRHTCTIEMWRLRRGDTARSAAVLQHLQSAGADAGADGTAGWQPRICMSGLTAELLLARHDRKSREAVFRFDSLMALGTRGFGVTFGNLWVARLLVQIREPERALVAASRVRRDWDQVLYLADIDAFVLALPERSMADTLRRRVEARRRALRGAVSVDLDQ